MPGQYRVDFAVNGRVVSRVNVQVAASTDPDHGAICMTRTLLEQASVDLSRLSPESLTRLTKPDACPTLPELVPQAVASLDTGELRLDATIPQSMLRRAPRGYVSPELWDRGVTAATLGYTLNANRSTGPSGAVMSAYLGLNAGVNMGSWYLRHNGSFASQQGGAMRYQGINTYVLHDLPSIRGRLVVGGLYTSGELFDTLPFIGAQVASDDRMLPDSQQGYAPVVRGIADTNAHVTVHQNGVLLYDTTVSPGPFTIDDLYPTGYGGNLDVTIVEADGRRKTFSVPYASVPQLLRPGRLRYSLTAGVLHDRGLTAYQPKLFQGTLQRGISNDVTGYGGWQVSDKYVSILGGVALGTPLGAVAFDATGARAWTPSQTLTGSSVRLSYGKYFESTQSNISVGAYRLSSSGFMDFSTAAHTIDAQRQGLDGDGIFRPKSRVSLNFNQALGSTGGQLAVSAFAQNYWNHPQRDLQFQIGYSNRARYFTYSVSVNRVRNGYGRMENQYMLSLTMPLGRMPQAPQLAVNVTQQPDRGVMVQTMVNGSAGMDNAFRYGIASAYSATAGASGSLSGQYISPVVTAQATYAQGVGYRSGSIGLSGMIVAHPAGVTLSPYTGSTIAIVAAPAAAGAKILGFSGLSLDRRGYGVLPYLTPYRQNEVALDPAEIPADVELKLTSQNVVPVEGSVVMLHYGTVTGRAVLIDTRLPNGDMPPMGADVRDQQGNNVGIVGQGGRAYARMARDVETLSVAWGKGVGEQCDVHVALPPEEAKAGKVLPVLLKVSAPCT